MSETTAIEATGLEKTYTGVVRALDGLGFSVPAGTVFGLLGPNGAGKSTTVKVLTTLTRPDAGSATVAGIDVLTRPSAVRQRIGVVAQRSGAIRELTGRENLRLQAKLYGVRCDTAGLLDQFGLTDAADRVVRTYSGGMQRRLDIAVALVHRPSVLFLDEPTTGLDPEARSGMWTMLAALTREQGLTILLTTHYLEEADKLASQLAIVDRGRVVASGSPDSLKAELRGDAIQIELADANGSVVRARTVLDRMRDVRAVTVDGSVVRARVDQGATALPSVLAALDAESVPVAAVTVARPSLDDVYLHHAGRAWNAAGRSFNAEVNA